MALSPQVAPTLSLIIVHFKALIKGLSGTENRFELHLFEGAECYAILSENLFQEFSLPYNQLVRLEFAETKCAEFVTVARLGLKYPRQKYPRLIKSKYGIVMS